MEDVHVRARTEQLTRTRNQLLLVTHTSNGIIIVQIPSCRRQKKSVSFHRNSPPPAAPVHGIKRLPPSY